MKRLFLTAFALLMFAVIAVVTFATLTNPSYDKHIGVILDMVDPPYALYNNCPKGVSHEKFLKYNLKYSNYFIYSTTSIDGEAYTYGFFGVIRFGEYFDDLGLQVGYPIVGWIGPKLLLL